MNKIKVLNIVGARPNFMKIAPIMDAMKIRSTEFDPILIHTGQHYDEKMSKLFFDDLEMSEPDIYMGIGSGSHANQTARIMTEFEKVLVREKPDLVLVVGDVNSTIACALTAAKLHVPVAHVEAGLRSFDRTMPEEINRILTDQLSDLLFTTEADGTENLIREGINPEKIHFVGNVMIDCLIKNREKFSQSSIFDQLNLADSEYALLTLHRPSNVDQKASFSTLIQMIEELSAEIKIVFPVHPRTQQQLGKITAANLITTTPLGYLDFLSLMSKAKFVLTDSGGIQEETTYLGVPCLTMRDNTERPVTLKEGTNTLVGTDTKKIKHVAMEVIGGQSKTGTCPEKWDGHAAERIINVIVDKFSL